MPDKIASEDWLDWLENHGWRVEELAMSKVDDDGPVIATLRSSLTGRIEDVAEDAAALCYEQADAMLKARAKQPEPRP